MQIQNNSNKKKTLDKALIIMAIITITSALLIITTIVLNNVEIQFFEQKGNKIKESYSSTENNTWDISENGDGSVVATLAEDGTLTISGTGKMKDMNSLDSTDWYEVNDKVKSVIIEEGVTNISDAAFSSCRSLISIEIPNSVTSIGMYAFSGCSNLTSIVIQEGVTSIGRYAFSYCESLTSIEIPNSVTSIGDSAFSGCKVIKKVDKFNNDSGIIDILKRIQDNSDILYAGNTGLELSNCTIEGNTIQIIDKNSLAEINVLEGALEGLTFITFDNLTWDISENGDRSVVATLAEDGTLTISGTGKMKDWSSSDSTDWYEMKDRVKSVIIEEGVTSIGYKAFYECRSLTSIEIPNTVTSIDDYAFCLCTSLTSIEIPNSVTDIGSSAFSACGSLTSIEIPNSVTSIGSGAFSGCTSLKSIEIPNSVTSIQSSAFNGCTSLTSIVIQEGITSIGYRAFSECTSLACIEIPNSVTSIGDYVFSECTSLTSIEVDEENKNYMVDNGVLYTKDRSEIIKYPEGKKETIYTILTGATNIRDDAFSRCTSLISIEIPNSVTTIGSSAFNECTSLTNIEIPDGVTSIGIEAFEDCTSLTSIEISNSVVSMEWGVFAGCTSLTSIEIPNSVTSIGNSAFSRCTSLTIIKIPNSVTSIGEGAFTDCTSLTSIEIDKENKNYIDDNGVLYTKDGSEIIKYPEGKKETIYTILTGATSIRDGVFDGCTSLTNIEIPDSVTSIGDSAFYGCTSLTSIEIPNDVTSIGYWAFYGCTSLTSIEIPNSVTNIGWYAFNECTNLTSIEIPNSVTSIGNYVFKECTSLTNIVIPDSVTDIGWEAFYECTSLTSIEIPNSVTSIGRYAFCGCTNLTNIVIPNSVTSIFDYGAFFRCPSLTIYCKSDSYVKEYAINENIKYVIDDEPPTITSVIGNPTEWTNKDVTLTINAEDSVVGLAKKPYSFDGGITWQLENAKTYTENTAGIIIKVKDKLGNIYTHETIDITKIDKQSPTENKTWDISENGDGSVVATLSEDGILTISGTGKMKDWSNSNSTDWYEMKDKVKFVIIEEGVTNIGMDAFLGYTSLTDIVIPNSVTNIGWYAFYGCTSLISIQIPNSVTSIGAYAFNGCTSLTSIKIPNGVTIIEGSTFRECTSLTSVEIPNSVTAIGENAFWDCTSLTSIKIPNSVTSIAWYAFHGCTNLTSVEIANGVTDIGEGAFQRCTSLTSIKFPNSITSLGKFMFDACPSLTNIEIDEENKNYKDDNGVLYTKDGSEIIRFPEGKKETIYTILTGTTSIGPCAFERCTSLTKIVIPDSVTTIDENALYGSTSLISIQVDENNKNYMDDNGVLYTKDRSEIIKYPEGKKETIYTILTGTTSIGNEAFIESTGLTSIEIPNSVTSIGSHAFRGCTGLKNVVIPDSVTSIGFDVFYRCTNLKIYCTSDSTAKEYAINNNIKYVIDDEAPTITSVIGKPTEWTREDVTLTINAEDSLSGLAEKPYSFDGGETWQAENTNTYTVNSAKTVIKVKDKLDNIYIYIIHILIDKKEPTITSITGNVTEWTKEDVVLTINGAQDMPSGLAEKPYSFDGGETWQAENTKTYTENTSGIIIKVKDRAGNVATYNETVDITKIDKQAPTITSVEKLTKLIKEGVILKISAQDNLSGLDAKPYSFDGGATWQTENTKTYAENTTGIVVKVKDQVGNIATYEEINIDIISKLQVESLLYEEKKEENNTYITNITPETSIKEFIANIKTNGTIEIYKGTEKITNTDTNIGTGMTVKIILNQERLEYTTIIKGDINGDGNVKLSDLSKLKLSLIGTTTLEGAYKYSADLNGDGNVKLSDLSKMKLYLVGNGSL